MLDMAAKVKVTEDSKEKNLRVIQIKIKVWKSKMYEIRKTKFEVKKLAAKY
jgi:hypothetical protein